MMEVTILNRWPLIKKFWITIHLGKNPKKGGSPPKDKRRKNEQNWIERGIDTLVKWFSWILFVLWNRIIRGRSKTVYKIK